VTRPLLLRAFPTLVVLALSLVVALGAASPARAATPCGKKVLGDWFDNGRIDRLYPLNCYEEAIDAIPPDIRDYADAQDVITRALQAALHGKLATGSSKDPSPDGTGTNGGANGGTGSAQGAPGVDTSSPSSVPIPLLVLGGMSIVLLAAGGIGYFSRRRQAAEADVDDEESLD
jgi:hypothetical protein